MIPWEILRTMAEKSYNTMATEESSLDDNDRSTTSPLDSLSESEWELVSPPTEPSGPPSFLNLPLEIRHQIYKWVHICHPVEQSQLTPWFPTPTYSVYLLQAVIVPGLIVPASNSSRAAKTMQFVVQGGNVSRKLSAERDQSQPKLLSAHRPLSRVPTTLLRTCKQVYTESRAVPFLENEFVFANWFSSGMAAARAFVKGLDPWQRGSMRHVRLELHSSDLVGARLDSWRELCSFWAPGLRGLRLKVLLDKKTFVPYFEFIGQGDRDCLDDPWELVGSQGMWIGEGGLGVLGELRQVEVELAGTEWSDERKVEWCGRLGERMNEGRVGAAEVAVFCVEKAPKGWVGGDACGSIR